eukprot:scaffold4252_cov60-Attheya_sp.AAC.2
MHFSEEDSSLSDNNDNVLLLSDDKQDMMVLQMRPNMWDNIKMLKAQNIPKNILAILLAGSLHEYVPGTTRGVQEPEEARAA